MSAEIFDMKLYKKALKLAKKGKSLKSKPTSCVMYKGEKQIAELERKLEQTEKDLADYQFNYPTIKELQNENAELNNFIMQSKKDGISPINALIIKNLGNQLTNAKEIIKKFLLWENDWHNKTESKYELLKEAEQFLNEVEK